MWPGMFPGRPVSTPTASGEPGPPGPPIPVLETSMKIRSSLLALFLATLIPLVGCGADGEAPAIPTQPAAAANTAGGEAAPVKESGRTGRGRAANQGELMTP